MSTTAMQELTQATPDQIAFESRSSFLVSFSRLEPARKQAIIAVYAYCRVVDDAVDEAKTASEGRARLQAWREELDRAFAGAALTPLGRALGVAASSYGVEKRWLDLVAEGVAMDLEPKSYPDFAALEQYTYKVASAVGRACLPIFGAPQAHRFAEELGHALQLTNILRDIVPDARLGRVYLPADLRATHLVDLTMLRGEGRDADYAPRGPVARLVAVVVERAKAHFAAADAAMLPECAAALRPARIMGAVYRDLLARVQARGGDLRAARPRVPNWKKLWIVWRTKAR